LNAKIYSMEKLIRFTTTDLSKITNHRSGEVKFGEKMVTIPKDQEVVSFLTSCEQKFVLFGIPEDIGIRANYGRPGADSAWDSAIKTLQTFNTIAFVKALKLLF